MTRPRDLLTELRVPVVDLYPQAPYLAAFNGRSAFWPRSGEARILASFIACLRSRYAPRQQERMLAEPFDTDPALVPYVFHKRGGPGDWAYRRDHWTEGPFWWPIDSPAGNLTLVALLDHISEGPRGAWGEWKAAHPDVFGEG